MTTKNVLSFFNLRCDIVRFLQESNSDSYDNAERYSVLKDRAIHMGMGWNKKDVDDALSFLKICGVVDSVGRLWWVVVSEE
jgi:hypothetical protein